MGGEKGKVQGEKGGEGSIERRRQKGKQRARGRRKTNLRNRHWES